MLGLDNLLKNLDNILSDMAFQFNTDDKLNKDSHIYTINNKEMENKINLWVFWYNSMTYESSSFPISYHRTEKGALEAMEKHKEMKRKEREDFLKWDKEFCEKYEEEFDPDDDGGFGAFESWSVEPFVLEILD